MKDIQLRRGCLAAGLLLAVSAAPGEAAPKPRTLLPNLVALRSAALYLGGATPVSDSGDTVFPCQASEVVHDSPTPVRCLRFETRAANAGTGPLELHHRVDRLASDAQVSQRVYSSNGRYRDSDAGGFVLDPTHGHFHYEDFAVANLWRSNAQGRRLDRRPLRAGRKAGFCLMDVYPYRTAGPRKYADPNACYPTSASEAGVAQVSGISPGWVDHYDASVPHQYIEISGVPDGYYLLQIVLDPLGRLREQTKADNTVWQRIRLCGDEVDLVGFTTRCAS
ncbi:MAG TPA: lysyl oxidase family protein [Frankiaceae bacterium]|nr:lysyl oxidase family protein [Frankiaceae bacterium]